MTPARAGTRRYRRGGFEALKPRERSDQGQSRALSPELAELIITLKSLS